MQKIICRILILLVLFIVSSCEHDNSKTQTKEDNALIANDSTTKKVDRELTDQDFIVENSADLPLLPDSVILKKMFKGNHYLYTSLNKVGKIYEFDKYMINRDWDGEDITFLAIVDIDTNVIDIVSFKESYAGPDDYSFNSHFENDSTIITDIDIQDSILSEDTISMKMKVRTKQISLTLKINTKGEIDTVNLTEEYYVETIDY